MSSPATRNEETVTENISSPAIIRKFIPSLTTSLLIGYFIISFRLNGDVTPLIRRGFFCNDSSIKYPFKKDTISVKILLLVALVIPGIVIKFCDRNLQRLIRDHPNLSIEKRKRGRKISGDSETEMDSEEAQELIEDSDLRLNVRTRRRITTTDDDSTKDSSGEQHQQPNTFTSIPLDRNQDDGRYFRFSLWLRKAFDEFQLFQFGFCTTMLFTGIGKITCGRFRPHFMQRCQPDVDCSTQADDSAYIEKFTCTNSLLTQREMSYISTSWPSGHAAIMFFSMSYMIVYLNRISSTMTKLSKSRCIEARNPLLFYGLYVLMIGLAGYIAGTRISDYHHHALDVFSGSIIGFAIAMVLTRTIPVRVILLRGTT